MHNSLDDILDNAELADAARYSPAEFLREQIGALRWDMLPRESQEDGAAAIDRALALGMPHWQDGEAEAVALAAVAIAYIEEMAPARLLPDMGLGAMVADMTQDAVDRMATLSAFDEHAGLASLRRLVTLFTPARRALRKHLGEGPACLDSLATRATGNPARAEPAPSPAIPAAALGVLCLAAASRGGIPAGNPA